MMRLLTRYILRQFLQAIGASLVAFIAIFVVVDLIQRLDVFLDRDVAPGLVVLYYVHFLPYIVVLTIPVSLLLGSLFTFGQLGKYGELTAIKASGVSLYRVIGPMLGVSLLIAAGVFAAGEWVVPESNQRRTEIQMQKVERVDTEGLSIRNNVFYRGDGGRQYVLRLYNGQRQRAQGVFVVEFREGAVVRTIEAEEMVWTDGRWVLQNGAQRQFYPHGGLKAMERFDALPCPHWTERPDDFSKRQKKPEEMNYAELRDYIQKVQRGGGDAQGFLVDLHLKLAFPCANVIIVLFGGALAAHVRKSGATVGVALSVGICFIYWGLLRTSQALGHAGALSPAVAAWGPNMVFGLLGLALLARAPK